MFSDVLSDLLEAEDGRLLYPEHHRVRFSLIAPDMEHEIWIPFLPPSQLTVDRVMMAIEKVLQSQSQWLLTGPMRILFVHAPLPAGQAPMPLSRAATKLVDFLRQKRSLLPIPVSPRGCCLPRAIAVAVALAEKHPLAKRLSVGSLRLQFRLAGSLMRRAGVDPECNTGGPADWAAYQAVLKPRYSLVVVSRDSFNSVVFNGLPESSRQVCVYHVENHFHVIKKLPAFMGAAYVCPACMGKSKSKGTHVCAKTCYYCREPGDCPEVPGERRLCAACHVYYPRSSCFDSHLSSGVCKVRKRCTSCGAMYRVAAGTLPHKCGTHFCSRCKERKPAEHLCYMQPVVKGKRELARRTYVFYDFESMTFDDGEHKPNLCVAHVVCTSCIHLPMTEEDCCNCGREVAIFSGRKTVEEFAAFLLNGKRAGAVCIAHNSSGYDAHFLLGYCHAAGIKPSVLLSGRKLMCLEVGGVRFLDSLNFFPMALSKLPRAFDIPDLVKGYFPHAFNVPENQAYEGPLPARHFYAPDLMSASGRGAFNAWYDEQERAQVTFNLSAELLKYCKSDVDILQRCCGVFRNLFVQHTGLEPFTKSVTIAAACNRVYRQGYLGQDQVGLIPPHGYYTGNQSAIAVCWLKAVSGARGVPIRHYGNGGEVKIGGRYVDGVGSNGELFFFHGCFWHGCPECHKDRDSTNPVSGLTFRELHVRTRVHMDALRASGRSVTEMWECKFRPLILRSPSMAKLLARCARYAPLKPRDSFFGGRTNAVVLHKKAGPGESIRYVDFCSLYPYVNKYARYPVGHPKVYSGEDIPAVVEGLIKCSVLPPRDLYHPVLPYRTRGKLTFPLCRTCADEATQGLCVHENPALRALTGTWVSTELEKAVSVGYRVLHRYEAWHFEKTLQYDPSTKSGGLWASFIDVWIKLKQQASGYPAWANTPQAKARYVADYEEHEGIALNPDSIEKNPGLRSLAKLIVCSHWGKFGQRSNKTQVTYVDEPVEFVRLMSDTSVSVSDVQYVNESHVAVYWCKTDDFDEGLPHTNVVLAAYTTAAARLKLYELLESLQQRVLYFDTDSVIYVHVEGLYNPPLSDYLGGLKDETDGERILEYCACGPKNYAYKLEGGDTVCKVRGFTLNYQTSQLLNFESLKRVVQGGFRETIDTEVPFNIVRDGRGKLYTKGKRKKYSLVYDKRFIDRDGVSTFPFGWSVHPR